MSRTKPPGAYGQGLAHCPLCTRKRSTIIHHGRLIFDHHSKTPVRTDTLPCDASGWLVEDDEVIR